MRYSTPRFTDEMKYAGREAVNNYYAERYEKEKEKLKLFEFGDTVTDMAAEHHHFYYQTYEFKFYGIYLSVLNSGVWYSGGAHTLNYFSVDNFNMQTGEILTLEDLFGEPEIYRPVLNRAIIDNLESQNEKLFPANLEEKDLISKASNLQFRITDSGIEFIFQEYEIAPYSAGTLFVTVPYEELSGIIEMK